MATCYYKSFDVVRFTSAGVLTRIVSTTLNYYNDTVDPTTVVGTVSVDANGVVAAGTFTGTVGDVIKFKHASYAGLFRLKSTATASEAFRETTYRASTFVVENAQTAKVSEEVDIFAQDMDNLNTPPILLGTGKVGDTLEIPYQTTIEKNFHIYPVAKIAKGIEQAGIDVDNYEALTVPSTGGSSLAFASEIDILTGTETAEVLSPEKLYQAIWKKGSDIASASTISVGNGGYFDITGTTTITDIDFATDAAGRNAVLQFDGAVTLTHGSNLILPGGKNITTAAGDIVMVKSEGSDVVRVTSYQRAANFPRTQKEVYLEQHGHTNAGLAAAISAINTTRTRLVITEDVSVTANHTIPATCTLSIANNARITVSGGVTLTIGKFENPGNVQVFAGVDASNHVVFSAGAVEKYNLAWYMGLGSSSDCSHAMTDIFTSVNTSGGGTVYIPFGSWKVHNLTFPDHIHFEASGQGMGPSGAKFIPKDGTTSYLFRFSGNFRNVSSRGVVYSIETNTTTNCLKFDGTTGQSGFGVDFQSNTFYCDGAGLGGSATYPLVDFTDQNYEVIRANFYSNHFIGADSSTCFRSYSTTTQFGLIGNVFQVGQGLTSIGVDMQNGGHYIVNNDFRGSPGGLYVDDATTYATLTCSITTGTATLTTTGAFTKAMEGLRVYHASALPSGRYIKSVDSATQATLSGNASDTLTAQSVTVYQWGNNGTNRSGKAIRVAAGARLLSTIENNADEGFNYFLDVIGGSLDTPINMSNNKVQGKILASNSCVINANNNELYSNCVEVASGQALHIYGTNTVWDNTVEQTLTNPLLEAKLGGAGVVGELFVHDPQFLANATNGHSIDQRRFYSEVFVPQTGSLSRPLLGVYTTYEATADEQQILQAWGVRDSASHQKKYSLTLDRAVENPYAGFYRWKTTHAAPYNGMTFDMNVGYGANVRGTVTQGTSRTTGVTCNAAHGIITCYDPGTYLLPGEQVTFTVTNTYVQNSDQVEVNIVDGSTTSGKTKCWSSDAGGNTFDITVMNTHVRTSETGTLKIKFRIKKDGGQLGITL